MYTNWATRIFWYLHWGKTHDYMHVCVLVNSIYSIWMGSTSKAAFHWINIEFDVKKNRWTLKIRMICDIWCTKWKCISFICVIVYKPRLNLLSQLMSRSFLFDSPPILRFSFHFIQILQRPQQHKTTNCTSPNELRNKWRKYK